MHVTKLLSRSRSAGWMGSCPFAVAKAMTCSPAMSRPWFAPLAYRVGWGVSDVLRDWVQSGHRVHANASMPSSGKGAE